MKLQSAITIITLAFTVFAQADYQDYGMTFRDRLQAKEYMGGLCESVVRRTAPRTSYANQKCADFDFDVVNWELPERSFAGYEDPSQEELEDVNLLNPLDLPKYRDFKIAVVINKNRSSKYGPGQRILVFAREGALPSIKKTGLLFYFKTSTGRPGFETPSGTFNVNSFSPVHMSSKYELVDMYWTIFFNGGIAIHSFNEFEMPRAISRLGKQKASHGCVRLESKRAQRLYHLIGQVGTDIVPKYQAGKSTGRYTNGYSTVIIVN
ncbi:MAG: hypothetical protein RJB66_524 [Pseudomonadota bacterium]|jgi:hypothetical protein